MARNTNDRGFSLKDELFNRHKVRMLGERFTAVSRQFSAQQFETTVMRRLLELELKQRIGCIADALEEQLPTNFTEAAALLVAALPEPLDPQKSDDDFGDFIYAPLGEYVARHGLTKKHLKTSLATLREITMRFSMEDAIRSFLDTYPKETLSVMQGWVADEHYHVRRLVSEGTRPLLPWSGRISLSPHDTVPLLTILHTDTTRYVTRSVANHLNDIAKSNPELVVQTLKGWQRAGRQDAKELAWMTRHALRTLVKQGDTAALALLGFTKNPNIVVSRIKNTPKTVPVGETLEFSCVITAQEDVKLMIDYGIMFLKASGKKAEKIYKITQVSLRAGEQYEVSKKHRFVKGATTLTFYEGDHVLRLQINGSSFGSTTFKLLT